jgi:mannosyltransferase
MEKMPRSGNQLGCFRQRWILLTVLLILGSVLRLVAIDKQSLWTDEIYSLGLASADLTSIMAGRAGDNHTPPLYYFLLHLWIRSGTSEFVLRSLSAAFGVGAIWGVYLLGKNLFGSRVGLVSSALMTFSPYHIYYSQEARMYTLVTLLTVISTYCFLRGLSERKDRFWMGFFISSVLSIYTHYYSIFILIGQSLFIFMFFRDYRPLITKWVLLQSFILLSYLPWIGVVFRLTESGGQSFRSSPFSMIPYAFFRFNAGYSLFPINYQMKGDISKAIHENLALIAIVFMVFVPVLLHAVWSSRMEKKELTLLLILLLLPALLAFAISLRVPMLSERYLIVSTPAYFVLLALGLDSIRRQRLKGVAVVGVALVFGFSLYNYYFSGKFGKEQWRSVASYVQAAAKPDDLLLFDASFVRSNFDYYYSGSLKRYGLPQPTNGILNNVIKALDGRDRIWLILSHQPSDFYKNWLRARYQVLDEKIFPLETGIFVYLFEATGGSAGDSRELGRI